MAKQAQLAAEGVGLLSQLAEAAGVAPGGEMPTELPGQQNVGNQFMGLSQPPRVGEANIQQARMAAQAGEPSVYPEGMGAIDQLGANLGTPGGAAVGMPSGQTIRR